jgi:hypothetical protein
LSVAAPAPLDLELRANHHGAKSSPFSGTLPRTTVVLGSNGAGKSKFLAAIRTTFAQRSEPVLTFNPFVRMGQIVMPNSEPPLAVVEQQYEQHRQADGQDKPLGESDVLQSFRMLRARDEVRRDDYFALLDRFEAGPDSGVRPQNPHSEFREALKLFEGLFGFEIVRNSVSGGLEAKPSGGGDAYPVAQLSGGESWALRTLPDFVIKKDQPVTVFVDEPESYFNEALAISFWSLIEAQRPHWRFIYATHRVDFASRPGVEKILLLKSLDKAPIDLTSIRDLPSEDHKRIMGYAPRLVKSEKTLFVEGELGSVDERFYEALVDDSTILIVPHDDCFKVKSAVSGQGVIEKVVREGILVRGVIDRDYRPAEYISRMTAPELAILDLHEVESYLCLPELLALIANKISGTTKSAAAYEDMIIDWVIPQKVKTIALHFNERINISSIGLSVPAAPYTDVAQVRNEFEKARIEAIGYVTSRSSQRLAYQHLLYQST